MFNATSLGDKGQPMTITSRSTSSAYLSAVQPVTEIRFTVRWRLLTVFARHFHDFLKIAEKYSSIAPERVYPVSAVNTFSLQYLDLPPQILSQFVHHSWPSHCETCRHTRRTSFDCDLTDLCDLPPPSSPPTTPPTRPPKVRSNSCVFLDPLTDYHYALVVRNEEETLAQRMARLSGKTSKRKAISEQSRQSSSLSDAAAPKLPASTKTTHGLVSKPRTAAAKPTSKRPKFSNAANFHSFKM